MMATVVILPLALKELMMRSQLSDLDMMLTPVADATCEMEDTNSKDKE